MSDLFSRILVAVDGSEPAKLAAVVGARLAREHGGGLTFCFSVHWKPLIAQFESIGAIVDPTPTIDAMKERGQKLLAEATEIAAKFAVDARCRALLGEPASNILDLARETASSLIVIGTHDGAGAGRLLIGSTTNAVLRRSPIPVLAVRPGVRLADRARRCFERVLVATDGSEPAEAAVDAALALPAEDRRELVFCSVAEAGLAVQAQTAVDRALANARVHCAVAQGRVLAGNPSAALAAEAQRKQVDLIVLGTHGRDGADSFALGSIAERIIRTAPLPVMVVRGPAPMSFEVHRSLHRAASPV